MTEKLRELSHSIGDSPFDREEMIDSLQEFADLYKERPVNDNQGGQLATQLFYSWFIAKKLQPTLIIESGVYKGQGTWAFEKAAPNAQIICLDPYPQYEQGYKSNKAQYIHHDFTQVDWTNADKENSICFFDDHQNCLNRLISVSQWGFKKVMFEDNYPPGQGDCLSLKKIFESYEDYYILPKLKAKEYLSRIISSYHEMPPIYDLEKNRWDEPWLLYGMNKPLLENTDQKYSETFLEGMNQYTWINYLELDL